MPNIPNRIAVAINLSTILSLKAGNIMQDLWHMENIFTCVKKS